MNSSSFSNIYSEDNKDNKVPILPDIHYYNKVAQPKSSNNEQQFIDIMNAQCPIKDNTCLNGSACSNDTFVNNLYNNSYGTDANGGTITNLLDNIKNSMNSKSTTRDEIATQIQYLTCQLAEARARNYDSDKLNVSQSSISLKEVFKKFSNLKPYLIIIFFVTIYLLIYGFFSSLDICVNILTSINEISLSYWMGLLCGLIIPIIILTINFRNVLCPPVEVNDNKYNITHNTTGTKEGIPSKEDKTLDYSMITIFIVLIFAFTSLLFILKKDVLGDKIYYTLVSLIFVIISVFIYIFYSMTPYFVSADQKTIFNRTENPIQIYIDNKKDISKITSNKDINENVNKLYITVILIIFAFAILFFIITRKKINNGFLNGLFGAGALLILPILWVFNYTIGIKYFYIYPVFIIIMRFIRYAGMVILYMMTEKNDELKDNFSDNLLEELDDIKNYSPSWSLIGVDLLKSVMNMNGFKNELSERVANNNNNKKNISGDKYFSSLLFLRLLLNDDITGNKESIIFAAIILGLTLIVGSIILYGVLKADDIKNNTYKVN
jgi:hypothetical protein